MGFDFFLVLFLCVYCGAVVLQSECSLVEAACMMSAGSVCRLHWWQAVKVWCVCQRQTCKAVAGFPCSLWATMLYKLFGGLVGAFLWLCRVQASTLMLMGGGVNYMPLIIMPIFENIGFSCLTICCTNTLSLFQNDSFGSV